MELEMEIFDSLKYDLPSTFDRIHLNIDDFIYIHENFQNMCIVTYMKLVDSYTTSKEDRTQALYEFHKYFISMDFWNIEMNKVFLTNASEIIKNDIIIFNENYILNIIRCLVKNILAM